MSQSRQLRLQVRWATNKSPSKTWYNLEYFYDRWRPTSIIAHTPRPTTRRDLDHIHRTVYLNTGKEVLVTSLELVTT